LKTGCKEAITRLIVSSAKWPAQQSVLWILMTFPVDKAVRKCTWPLTYIYKHHSQSDAPLFISFDLQNTWNLCCYSRHPHNDVLAVLPSKDWTSVVRLTTDKFFMVFLNAGKFWDGTVK
jgi:hypothetical protein